MLFSVSLYLFMVNLKLCPKDKQENTPGQVTHTNPVLICVINIQARRIWQLHNEPMQNYPDRTEEAAGKEQPGTNKQGVIPTQEYKLVKGNPQKIRKATHRNKKPRQVNGNTEQVYS